MLKEIWEDNHRFMFEMHVYTDKFFGFVKKIIDLLEIYELQEC